MQTIIVVIFILFLNELVISAKLPNTSIICHRKDGNFQKCLKAGIQDIFQHSTNAYPSIGLSRLDPYLIKEVRINAVNHGAANFNQHYKNVNLHGLSTVNLDTVNMDFEKKRLKLHGIVPLAEVDGEYEFSGRFLVLPIEGKGHFQGSVDTMDVLTEIDFDEFVRNDRKYYKIDNVRTYSTIKKFHIQFDNLFNGNKQLGDHLNRVLNDNWQYLFEDIRENYENVLSTIVRTEMSSLFNRVPIDDLFPE